MTEQALLKRSLEAIRTLQGKLDEYERRHSEPIAVVGMSCRFPGGATSPAKFWELLRDGRDGVVDVPPDRWALDDYYDPNPEAPGKTYTSRAGFLLEDIRAFHAEFFGISPREAVEMDPAHRLLLETSWEALEYAGLLSSQSKGSQVGIFVGISGSEFAMVPRRPEHISPFTATGSTVSIAPGRIAHALGLHGPAMAIDTACSSSLVAVHLACESLRRGECDAALAGGVNVMLSPGIFLVLCRMKALAPDGKCKAFDASADGYVRAEGCGMVALRRLSDASADRDPILAVIRGSAVNQDGHTSGLTVPNSLAQRALIERALSSARVSPREVGYLEAHGTGTPLGDPIEMQAVADILFVERPPNDPLRIGTVKSNIGHLEAAAGIAGLIKTVLVLQQGQVPPNLHLEELNPRLQAERFPVVFPRELQPWPRNGRPRIAGVSSFGFSGTNAHVVVEEAPVIPRSEANSVVSERPLHLLALSAHDESALRELARRLCTYLKEHPEARIEDVCYTINACRLHFAQRAALVTDSAERLAVQLRELVEGAGCRGDAEEGVPASQTAFVLDSDSDDVICIARELYETQPIYRAVVEECDEHFQRLAGCGIVPLLRSEAGEQDPLLRDRLAFVHQLGLAHVWAGWGVEPAAVVGRGTGELVGACLAGVMDLEIAVSFLVSRVCEDRSDSELAVLGEALRVPRLRLLSGSSGAGVTDQQATDPFYWGQRPDHRCAMADAVRYLAGRGYATFVQLGGRSDVTAERARWLRVIRSSHVWTDLLEALACLYKAGTDIDWMGFDRGYDRAKLTLPTYPFQRQVYWWHQDVEEEIGSPSNRAGFGRRADSDARYPLPGRLLLSPLEHKQFETRLNRVVLPELLDTGGLLHVGYYQEMLTAAVAELFDSSTYVVRDMEFLLGMYFDGEKDRIVQLVIDPADTHGWNGFRIYSMNDGEQAWALNVRGKVRAQTVLFRPKVSLQERTRIHRRCHRTMSGAEFYEMMRGRGIKLGASVRCVDRVWWRPGEVLASLRTEQSQARDYAMKLHPGILDACAQLFVLAGGSELAPDALSMITKVAEINFENRAGADPLWCHLRLEDNGVRDGHLVGGYLVFDSMGYFLAQTLGNKAKIITREAVLRSGVAHQTGFSGDRFSGLAERVRRAPGDDQRNIVLQYLRSAISDLLRVPHDSIPDNEPLVSMGMDSLAGLELKNRVKKNLDVELPMEYIIQGPSTVQLTDSTCHLLQSTAFPEGLGSAQGWYEKDYDLDIARWVEYGRISSCAEVRLFCIPYGVKGASLFSGWKDHLPEYIDVCPIQFPGKENRIHERPIKDIIEAVDALEQVLAPYLDRPFAFYGHSVGALIAYRTVYRLWRIHPGLVKRLFVAAYASPSIHPNPVYRRVMDAFKVFGFDDMPTMEELVNSPKERQRDWELYVEDHFGIETNDEIRAAVRPVGYCDFHIVHTYEHDPEEPVLDIAVTEFHGDRDTFVAEEERGVWRQQTSSAFDLRILSGDHFFLHPEQDEHELLQVITQQLSHDIR